LPVVFKRQYKKTQNGWAQACNASSDQPCAIYKPQEQLVEPSTAQTAHDRRIES